MTYSRVIPRDLFNEGNLLTCLGRLWVKLDDRRDHEAKLVWYGAGERPFLAEQDPSDGSISVPGCVLTVSGRKVLLFRPLNSRDKWPLWMRDGDEDELVFDDQGELSTEFWVIISQPEMTRQRRERGA